MSIEVTNLSFSYGDRPVLHDISFSVGNGEFLSIEDLANRTQLNGTIIKNLQALGVIKLQEKNQLSLDLFG